MSNFVHLHNHTHYSLLDGLAKPKDYIKIAKEQGSNAVAITDHGAMFGAVEFYQEAKKNDINPIIGCEFYQAVTSRFDKENFKDIKPYHLVLLAYNNEGYKNLINLVTKANLEGFYYKPRIDLELLTEYNKGIIGTSACLQGMIPRTLLSNNYEEAIKAVKQFKDILGSENFFLEMQHHPEISDQQFANEQLKKLSKDTKTPLIVTNDCHYALKEDAHAHDILICIQTNKFVTDEDRMRYTGDFSMRSTEDLAEKFEDIPEALSNTQEIADRCKIEMKFDQNLIPAFDTPKKQDPAKYLRKLCLDGLKERYGSKPSKEAKDRLDFELSIIHEMGFDTYFLIVRDFIMFAKSEGIMVGPGRGSAAGSIVSYCLKITNLDPLKYGLLFERFLNPARISMPDIDIDFADDRRDEVLDYVVEKYGREKVSQIITFGTMAARAAVRDTGRALGYPYPVVDKVAKLIPAPILGKSIPLKISVKEDPELSKVYNADTDAKNILDNAIKLEGTVRHAGTHACAVIISEKPLTNYTPLQKAPGKEDIITQFSMKPLEKIGLLKMDFLGLKNLTILQKTLKIIKRSKKKNIDLDKIPLDDKKTFKLLQEGKTIGVFQLESAGMRRYLKELKPTQVEDIIAMNALYRPGPMDWIPMYIKGKHNPDKVKYLHPSFEEVLKETYGVAVYQEQILQIAKIFAGFSLGEADILRKAVGKKDPKLLEEQRDKFIEGAIKNEHSEKFAKEVFEKVIEPFAGYGFNKSHAACYAYIAYLTAYLKSNYTCEFMAALLSSDSDNTDRVVIEINECEELGITVLPPSVNESFSNFTYIDDKHIRFGLSAIKGIGEGPIKAVMEARDKGGPFKNIEDFVKRVDYQVLNKKSIEAFAFSGAMDDFGDRKQIATSVEEIVKYAKSVQDSASQGQTDIFGMMDEDEKEPENFQLFNINVNEQSTQFEKLTWEKQYLGMYVSAHPLDGLKKYLSRKVNFVGQIDKKMIDKRVMFCGLIENLKKVATKSGMYMAYFTLQDPTAKISITVFPKPFNQFKDILFEDQVIVVEGKLVKRRDEVQLLCDSIKKVSLDTMLKKAKESGIFDENDKVKSKKIKEIESFEEKQKKVKSFQIKLPKSCDKDIMIKLRELLMENRGDAPVEILLQNEKGSQKIKIPFGVDLNKKLKDSIKGLLEKVCN